MTQFENHTNYNCRITTDSDEEFLVYANWMHNSELDQWKGWQCDAGKTRLHIDQDLNVWSGRCKNDFFGSVTDQFYTGTSTVCKQDTCSGCTDDLIVKKSKT